MKHVSALMFVTFALMFSTYAFADTLSSARDQPLTEVSHNVTLRMQGGIATYVVRRTFANAGDVHDEAWLWIDLPEGAVATDLRIRAGHQWHAGEFLPAEEAEAKYRELTGLGPSFPLDPALLAWETSSRLRLRVFPVPPKGTATLEYTLTSPLSWDAGEAVSYYPRGEDGTQLAPVVLQFPEHFADIVVDGQLATFEQPVVLYRPQLAGEAEIRLRANQNAIVGRKGSTHDVSLNNEEIPGFVKVEYDLPARLSEVPEDAKVVFLVDRSRSISEAFVQAQLDIIEGFASYLPDAHFEIVMVDRGVEPLLGAFTVHNVFLQALAALRERGVPLQNGSNLDEGLAMGRALLKDVEGPRFIIALTDNQLRLSWDTSAYAESTDITTHVVVLDSGFERDDTHRLAPIALQGGGILVHTGIDDHLRTQLEHLVRPVRLEHVAITGIDDTIGDLEEGASYRLFQAFESAPEATLHAKLWTRPIEVTPHHRPDFDRATAGWVFSHDLYGDLDGEDMMTLATYARAVTPVTSYLAIEPGVRPSTEGLEHGAAGLGASGSGSVGGFGNADSLSPSTEAPPIDLDSETCREFHPDQEAIITVHTTTIEIVDVVATTTNDFTECMVEVAWEKELSAVYQSYPYRTETLTF